MAPFAKQGTANKVIGIDDVGLVQRLMLFDHCIIPTIWLEDVQRLLRIVDPEALCELLDTDAISFYIDSATAAEMGQARSSLKLTGNTRHLQDNEFSFSTIKGRDDPERARAAIDRLAATEGVPTAHAKAVAGRTEAAMLEPKGLKIHQNSFKDIYLELRNPDSTIVQDLIAQGLRSLGVKPSRLEVKVVEFVEEDFRINSNLTSRFGLSSRKAREVSLRALMDIASVYIRLAHMREFTCIVGMSEKEQVPWEMKVDSLVRSFTHESQRDRQFTRVARISGLGDMHLAQGGKIDLRRLIDLRNSDDLRIFKAWLKESNNKSDKEIRERVSSLRSKLGIATQSNPGKFVRLMLSCLPTVIQNPIMSQAVGMAIGATDAFLLEKLLPSDAILAVLGKYKSVFER